MFVDADDDPKTNALSHSSVVLLNNAVETKEFVEIAMVKQVERLNDIGDEGTAIPMIK